MKQKLEFVMDLNLKNKICSDYRCVFAKTLKELFDRAAIMLTKYNFSAETLNNVSIIRIDLNDRYSDVPFKFYGKYYSKSEDYMCDDAQTIIKRIKQNKNYKHDQLKYVSKAIKKIRKDRTVRIKSYYLYMFECEKTLKELRLEQAQLNGKTTGG